MKRKALFVEGDLPRFLPRLDALFPPDEWDVTACSSAAEARAAFEAGDEFNLLLVDFDLAEGDGRQFLDFVRTIDDNIPAFLLSGAAPGGFTAWDVKRLKLSPEIVDKNLALTDPRTAGAHVRKGFEDFMADMCAPNVHSETGNLRAVLVHTPTEEINYIDPYNLNFYLFESRPELQHIANQHRGFLRAIRQHGKRPIVLDTAQLLYDIIRRADPAERFDIVVHSMLRPEVRKARGAFARAGLVFSPLLDDKLRELAMLDARSLTSVILCGLNIAEFSPGESSPAMLTARDAQVVYPAANLYFMRDPIFTLGRTLTIARMHWPIRRRETSILRQVAQRHPFLREAKANLIDQQLDADEQVASIEGGDVMVLGKRVFAVAQSERSMRASIRKLAEELLRRDEADVIYQPVIPARRAFIHLDTVCSVAGDDWVVAHPDAVTAYPNTLAWTRESLESQGEPLSLGKNFIRVLQEHCGKRVIETAGGSFMAQAEQFDDATNVFMLNPGTAVAYDRNRRTNEALRDHGIKVVEFAGSDLVMGRGGPRCMTMPLNRD